MNEELIFDFEKEAILFINNRLFQGIYDTTTTNGLLDYSREFVKNADIVSTIKIEISNIEDTAEILLPKLKYAIRNEDIKLLDAIVSGFVSVPFINYLQGTAESGKITAIVSIVAALVKLGRDLLKGVILNPKELLLLVILKNDGAHETIDLKEKLRAAKIDIEEKELLTIIGDLSQKKSIIGTNVSLVSKTADGRWVTTI